MLRESALASQNKCKAQCNQTASYKFYVSASNIQKLWGVEAVCMVNFRLEKISPDWGFKHKCNMFSINTTKKILQMFQDDVIVYKKWQ